MLERVNVSMQLYKQNPRLIRKLRSKQKQTINKKQGEHPKIFVVDPEQTLCNDTESAIRYLEAYRKKWKYTEPIKVIRVTSKKVFVIYYTLSEENV